MLLSSCASEPWRFCSQSTYSVQPPLLRCSLGTTYVGTNKKNCTKQKLARRFQGFFHSQSSHQLKKRRTLMRLSGSPTQLRIKEPLWRVRSKRLLYPRRTPRLTVTASHLITIFVPENVFHSMPPTKLDISRKAQTSNLSTDLWPMPPEHLASAMDLAISSFPAKVLRQPVQPTPAMRPKRIEDKVETHQFNYTNLNLSLISIKNVLMNSSTSQ